MKSLGNKEAQELPKSLLQNRHFELGDPGVIHQRLDKLQRLCETTSRNSRELRSLHDTPWHCPPHRPDIVPNLLRDVLREGKCGAVQVSAPEEVKLRSPFSSTIYSLSRPPA